MIFVEGALWIELCIHRFTPSTKIVKTETNRLLAFLLRQQEHSMHQILSRLVAMLCLWTMSQSSNLRTQRTDVSNNSNYTVLYSTGSQQIKGTVFGEFEPIVESQLIPLLRRGEPGDFVEFLVSHEEGLNAHFRFAKTKTEWVGSYQFPSGGEYHRIRDIVIDFESNQIKFKTPRYVVEEETTEKVIVVEQWCNVNLDRTMPIARRLDVAESAAILPLHPLSRDLSLKGQSVQDLSVMIGSKYFHQFTGLHLGIELNRINHQRLILKWDAEDERYTGYLNEMVIQRTKMCPDMGLQVRVKSSKGSSELIYLSAEDKILFPAWTVTQTDDGDDCE